VALAESASRLVLGVLHHHTGGESGTLCELDTEIVQGAWRLVEFFASHARRVRTGQGRDAPPWARAILRWIRNHPESSSVTVSDVTRVYAGQLGCEGGATQRGFDWLARNHGLRPRTRTERSGGTRGPAQGTVWEIHPALRAAVDAGGLF
jgi:hypothetical protein